MAIISILGLYNFDNSVFDGFQTPENIDRETTINNILLECAEMEIIYPDINIMKLAISNWTKKELPIWIELQKTREYNYNPIWNKDGSIIERESRDLNRDETGSRDKTANENGSNSAETKSGTDTTTNTNGTIENSVMGYNSTQYENKDKTESITETETNQTYRENFDQELQNETKENEKFGTNTKDTGTIERERIEQGNIGIVTTQRMIQEQREVVQFNVMDYIIQSFKKRFCLLIY